MTWFRVVPFSASTVADDDQGQDLALCRDRAVLGGADPDGAVLEPAAQLLAARLGILGKTSIQVGHLGADVLDAGQPQRLVRRPLQLEERLPLIARERLEVPQGGDHILGTVAGRDEVDQAAHLGLCALEPFPAIAQVRRQVVRVVAQLLGHALARLRDAVGREQMLADRGQDLRARDILADAPVVAAQTLPLVGLATVVPRARSPLHGHRRPAHRAREDARQQVRGALERKPASLPPARILLLEHRQTRLHRVPQLLIDDPKLGPLPDDHLRSVARAGLASIGAWNLDPLLFLETPHADVALVVEDRANRRGPPAKALVLATDPRRWDGVSVQAVRDAGQRVPVPRLDEDAMHDRRFALVDCDAVSRGAGLRGHRVEAICDVTRREAVQCAPFKTSQRLVSEIVEIDVRHEALNGERQLRVLRAGVDPIGYTQERHLIELELLEDLRRVREVARYARHIFCNDHPESAVLYPGEHSLNLWSIETGTRHRNVGKYLCVIGVSAMLSNELTAAAHLIRDTALVLQHRGEASIDANGTGLDRMHDSRLSGVGGLVLNGLYGSA